ncbi:MAG: LytR/AlgR family response regulator transcription factor [Lishizhenia sp.]
MSKSKVYLLEDDFITQALVKKTLKKFNFELIGFNDNAEEAFKEIQTLKPDVVLLDIHVNGEKTGLWLADLLIGIPFIFLTGYGDIKTLENVLKTKPASFLVKPYNEVQLIASIELTLSNERYKPSANNEEIVIKDGYEYVKIKVEEILFVEANNNYIIIHTKHSKRHVIRETLIAFLENDYLSTLTRTHRSYAVNLNHVTRVTTEFALLGSEKIPITRSYRNAVLMNYTKK